MGRSPQEQEAECRAWAAKEGWEIVGVESDVSRSASRYARLDRPGFQRLRERMARGEADMIMAWEASRNSRKQSEFIELRDSCREARILMAYNGRVLDPSRTDDSFTIGLDGLMAERQSDETRDRIMRAMRANAVAGRPHGRLTYGYLREYDEATGHYVRTVEHPETAPLVKEMARRLLDGESLRTIAHDFTVRGIPTPRPPRPDSDLAGKWSPTTIRQIVLNPAYAGFRVHQGQIVGTADWPPLISQSDQARLAEVFANPARRKAHAPGRYRHLLTGIVKCSECGHNLQVGINRGCASYRCLQKDCYKVARAKERVDFLVTEIVIRRLSMDDARDLLKPDDEGQLQRAADEAALLRSRLSEATTAAATGKITFDLLGHIEKEIRPQLADAERRAKPSLPPGPVHDLVTADDVRLAWSSLSLEQQRAVVSTLLDRIVVEPAGKNARGFIKEFDPAKVKVLWHQR